MSRPNGFSSSGKALAKSISAMGGLARAKKLTSEVLSNIGTKGAAARWNIPEAVCEGQLTIGEATIPCAVIRVEDGEYVRVLTQQEFLTSLGRANRGIRRDKTVVAKLPPFLAAKNLKPFIDADLEQVAMPVKFKSIKGGIAYGYRAELLPKVCNVFLKAQDADKLHVKQFRTAEQAYILIRGLAEVGIIALVDEATNFQAIRQRWALREIIEKFIRKEVLLPWTRRFPEKFYRGIFRLKGWEYDPIKRPQVIGHYTNDLVYDRLAPGILKELRERTPKDERGHRRFRFHMFLTEDIGHPKLQEHFISLFALMDGSLGWGQFYALVDRALPRYGDTLPLPLEDF